MLTAIKLYNKHFINTDKVNDIWTYGMLTSEFAPLQTPVSQVLPEESLCIRHAFS